ncbi:MAG: HNH endonuclease [Oscillibacter sp.]|uniref:HNH endonuclease n=1 Tax=Oscillibacter sp. TaxID=1945593 RepID=UPI001321D791|nr:HNH endonuclease [Oscillibacter sp.]MUU13069.1 HNH endonuclease [Oscillibacter sp.]
MGFDYTSKRWGRKRAAILRRDDYRCVWCRRYGRNRPAVVVHHIKHVDEYPELAYEDSNLVSLCQGVTTRHTRRRHGRQRTAAGTDPHQGPQPGPGDRRVGLFQ